MIYLMEIKDMLQWTQQSFPQMELENLCEGYKNRGGWGFEENKV